MCRVVQLVLMQLLLLTDILVLQSCYKQAIHFTAEGSIHIISIFFRSAVKCDIYIKRQTSQMFVL